MSLHPPFREAAAGWLEEDPDPATADELRALIAAADGGDTAAGRELAERFTGTLEFGTAGLRGILGAGPQRMNRVLVRKVTAGLAAYLLANVPDAKRLGVVIGRKGSEIDKLKEELSKMTGKEIYVDIQEVKQPELNAQLVAENVAMQLERRVSFRRALKKAVQIAMDFGAEGIKLRCAGRLGGAEIARVEQYHEGRVPLHTLRANIDYGFAEAKTMYGKIGIKCWICRGEHKPERDRSTAAAAEVAPIGK